MEYDEKGQRDDKQIEQSSEVQRRDQINIDGRISTVEEGCNDSQGHGHGANKANFSIRTNPNQPRNSTQDGTHSRQRFPKPGIRMGGSIKQKGTERSEVIFGGCPTGPGLNCTGDVTTTTGGNHELFFPSLRGPGDDRILIRRSNC